MKSYLGPPATPFSAPPDAEFDAVSDALQRVHAALMPRDDKARFSRGDYHYLLTSAKERHAAFQRDGHDIFTAPSQYYLSGLIATDVLEKRFGERGRDLGRALMHLLNTGDPAVVPMLAVELEKSGVNPFKDIRVLEVAGRSLSPEDFPLSRLVASYRDLTPAADLIVDSHDSRLLSLRNEPQHFGPDEQYDYTVTSNVISQIAVKGGQRDYTEGALIAVMANHTKPGGTMIHVNSHGDPNTNLLNDRELQSLSGLVKDNARSHIVAIPSPSWQGRRERFPRTFEPVSAYRKTEQSHTPVTAEAYDRFYEGYRSRPHAAMDMLV